jgi:predicted secreted hydrolase
MSRRGTAWLLVGTLLALSVLGTLVSVRRSRGRPAPPPALAVGGVLSAGDTRGFARALAPRPFDFPADHGPHPEFRSEWWYLTGHLQAGPRRFGYQLTFFRQALAPESPPRPSAWASRQAYMAHLAVTDEQGRRFLAFERLSREGLGLAGARAAPFRVWLEDWHLEGIFPITVRASEPEGVALALTVEAGRGPILQGDRGLSRKGPEPGNASYYYSWSRLPTRGRLTIGGESFEVDGTSWLDREWSTSALGPALAGWDWLALQLSDGRDLMVYRLRGKDGRAAPESRATLVAADGTTQSFAPEAFSFTPVRWWEGPTARYPVGVRVEIPSLQLSVETRPFLDDQELALSFRYWEGAVTAAGRAGATPVTAAGYLELTGY